MYILGLRLYVPLRGDITQARSVRRQQQWMALMIRNKMTVSQIVAILWRLCREAPTDPSVPARWLYCGSIRAKHRPPRKLKAVARTRTETMRPRGQEHGLADVPSGLFRGIWSGTGVSQLVRWRRRDLARATTRTKRLGSDWSHAHKMARNIRNVRRILVRGSMPPCRLRRRKFWKCDYEMVHSEVYLNKYVVSIAPFSTPGTACPDCSQNIT